MIELPTKSKNIAPRPRPGQPKKEPTATVTFRVPARLREEFKEKVRKLITELKLVR